jgi:hypothetical protein
LPCAAHLKLEQTFPESQSELIKHCFATQEPLLQKLLELQSELNWQELGKTLHEPFFSQPFNEFPSQSL